MALLCNKLIDYNFVNFSDDPNLDFLGCQYRRNCVTQSTLDSSCNDTDQPQDKVIEQLKCPSWLPAMRVRSPITNCFGLPCAMLNLCGFATEVDVSCVCWGSRIKYQYLLWIPCVFYETNPLRRAGRCAGPARIALRAHPVNTNNSPARTGAVARPRTSELTKLRYADGGYKCR